MDQLSADAVLRRAFSIYKERLGLLLGSALATLGLGYALLIGLALFGALGGPVTLTIGLVVGIGAAIVSFATYSAILIRIVEADVDGREPARLRELMRIGLSSAWPLIWITLLVALATVFGFLLLIVPGVILLVIWAVFVPVIVVEGKGFDALARSRELVKGNGWNVFGVGAITFSLVIGIAIVGSIAQAVLGRTAGGVVSISLQLLTFPVADVIRASLYFELARLNPAESKLRPTPEDPGPGGYGPINFG